MGGNAFPGKTRRYAADEYYTLVNKLTPVVEGFASRAVAIPAYHSKESFGDLDMLYTPSRVVDESLLSNSFETTDLFHNGDVWSLVHGDFQVDLIHTPVHEFDYALKYFGYNDFGNLCGKLAHKFGLKHGHDGLKYVVRSADHVLGEIVLTLDPTVTFDLLDIKYPEDGFNTLEDIFRCVTASKVFSSEMFAFENMNHIARIRDKKRSTYTAFLQYIADHPELPVLEFNRDKTVYLPMIFERFPHAKPKFDELWAKKHLLERAREKFNATLVTEMTGLQNKELGEIMRKLRPILTPEIVDTMSQDEIRQTINDVWKQK